MEYTPISPFMRPISHGHLRVIERPEASVPARPVNNWELLRELSKAQAAFGVSERDLTVLQGLLSFFPEDALGGNAEMIVFPSNKAICERLNGMPCSTMRRHLANLVQTGFVVRRDSPNGKRYARRYGDEKIAFGFDLAPLAQRFVEVCEAAEAVRAAEERYKRLRSTVSLMRRDLAGLVDYGRSLRPDRAIWDQASDLCVLTARDLRRKLDFAELQQMESALSEALNAIRDLLEPVQSQDMSTNEVTNEQHYQNSNKDSYDFEPRLEKAQGEGSVSDPTTSPVAVDGTDEPVPIDNILPRIPLGLVLAACSEYQTYAERPVRHWHDLVRVAG